MANQDLSYEEMENLFRDLRADGWDLANATMAKFLAQLASVPEEERQNRMLALLYSGEVLASFARRLLANEGGMPESRIEILTELFRRRLARINDSVDEKRYPAVAALLLEKKN